MILYSGGGGYGAANALQKRKPADSAMMRVLETKNRALGGRETYLPARLLYGVLPAALLESCKFWQGEDMTIRGEPRCVVHI